MNKKPPIQIRVSPEALREFSPEQLRAKAIAEAEQKRFQEIADEIIQLLKKESVLVDELPSIISQVTRKVNAKIDKATIEKILNL